MFNPVAPYRYLLPNLYLYVISQIQTSLGVVVRPGLVSTSPAFMRSIASHPAGLHSWLVQRNGKRPHFWGRLGAGGGQHNIRRVCQTAVTAPPRVDCVVWNLCISVSVYEYVRV